MGDLLQSSRRGGPKSREFTLMNKKSIAPLLCLLYGLSFTRHSVKRALLHRNVSVNCTSSVSILDVFKRGLMVLAVFWRRLTRFAGSVRAQLMVEIERNPLAMRQGAATIVCIAAAAVAMPLISHRAAEQRAGAEWAARSTSFQADLQRQLIRAEPNARVELTAYRTPDGLRARGTASLFAGADTHAMLVQAALRGPLAPLTSAPAAPPPARLVNARERGCLAQAIYYESRGETREGQTAVAEVVMNRVRSPAYPSTICAVVYQGSHRATGCQFSFTCDGSLHRTPRGRAWTDAQSIATQVMQGYARPVTQRATHYHTHAVNPVWSAGLVETTRIGSHVFYRFPNRSERATYQEALARRIGAGGTRRANAALMPEALEDPAPVEAAPPEDAALSIDNDAVATPAAEAPITTGATPEIAT